MPFRFSLESILTFRKNVEHAEELALNRILQEIAAAQLQLQRIEEDHRSFRAQRDRDLAKGLPAAYLQEIVEKEQYLENAAHLMRAQLPELNKKREAQLVVLRIAQQDREVLAGMRKQKHATYQREQNQRDQKALDDLFLSRMQHDD
jgi:flagellar export protein FliJ